jgi:hypothetical protein
VVVRRAEGVFHHHPTRGKDDEVRDGHAGDGGGAGQDSEDGGILRYFVCGGVSGKSVSAWLRLKDLFETERAQIPCYSWYACVWGRLKAKRHTNDPSLLPAQTHQMIIRHRAHSAEIIQVVLERRVIPMPGHYIERRRR